MKKNNKSSRITIIFITIVSILFIQAGCGGKKSDKINTRIIFTTGTVELNRPGSGTLKPQIGDLLQENDSIKTLEKSCLTFQTGDRCITRIDQNSEVKLSKLFSNNDAVLLLQKGDIAAKVSTLHKGEGYSVKTPTVVASVRGTEFSVSTFVKNEQVAVKKGSVSVRLINESEKSPEKETIVENGNTAVIKMSGEISDLDNRKIEVRPISNVESLAIEKIAITAMLPDLDGIKAEDLKCRQTELIRGTEEIDKKIQLENTPKDKLRTMKIENLIKKKTKTIEEIKEVFERIDEISLYSGQVINGAILARGNSYSVLTTLGVISIPEGDVRAVKIIK